MAEETKQDNKGNINDNVQILRSILTPVITQCQQFVAR